MSKKTKKKGGNGGQDQDNGKQLIENTEPKNDLISSLQAFGLGTKLNTKPTKKKSDEKNTDTKSKTSKSKGEVSAEVKVLKVKKKKQGVSTAPIFKSLDDCTPKAVWGKDWLAVDLPGARVLTYNEMFSILQYRKYEAFRYKKICKNLIYRAIRIGRETSTLETPYFDGPTKMTLLRIGAKEMDRDALPVVFKYFIDAFKKDPAKETLKDAGVSKTPKKTKNSKTKTTDEPCSIINDDNPNIIVEIESLQDKGEPRLAILLERAPNWNKTSAPKWEEWLAKKSSEEN